MTHSRISTYRWRRKCLNFDPSNRQNGLNGVGLYARCLSSNKRAIPQQTRSSSEYMYVSYVTRSYIQTHTISRTPVYRLPQYFVLSATGGVFRHTAAVCNTQFNPVFVFAEPKIRRAFKSCTSRRRTVSLSSATSSKRAFAS